MDTNKARLRAYDDCTFTFGQFVVMYSDELKIDTSKFNNSFWMENYFNPAAKKCSKDEGDERSLNLYVFDLSHKVVGTSRRDDTDSLLVTLNLNLSIKDGLKGGHIIRIFGYVLLIMKMKMEPALLVLSIVDRLDPFSIENYSILLPISVPRMKVMSGLNLYVFHLINKVVAGSSKGDTDSLLVTPKVYLALKEDGEKGGHIIRIYGSSILEQDLELGRCRPFSPPVSASTPASLRPLLGSWCLSTSAVTSVEVPSIVIIVEGLQVAGTTLFAVEAYLPVIIFRFHSSRCNGRQLI